MSGSQFAGANWQIDRDENGVRRPDPAWREEGEGPREACPKGGRSPANPCRAANLCLKLATAEAGDLRVTKKRGLGLIGKLYGAIGADWHR